MHCQSTILHVLETVGIKRAEEQLISNRVFAEKVDTAANGKPTLFLVEHSNIGRCYNNYQEVALNYDPSMEHHPCSNWGKVEPKEIKTVDGVNIATFDYSVDSSD
jgi:hypothetical protein